MKIRDLQQTINEIDRRGFLKGLGAAAATAAVPGLANAKSTATIPELIAISKKIKSIFAKNIVITGAVPVPTAPGRFRFTFDMQGKLLTKEKPESSGDEKLDQAVLNSATDIPPDIVALFKPEPDSKSVFINITVKDDWWKAGGLTGIGSRQQTTQQPEKQNQTRGVTRVGNYAVVSGYTLEFIKDRITDTVLAKNPDADIDDNGRTLTIKLHNPQSKHFGMALYKGLLGPRGSTMMIVVKFTFSERDNQIRVLPQGNIVITNAFGGVDTQPYGDPNEFIAGLEKMLNR